MPRHLLAMIMAGFAAASYAQVAEPPPGDGAALVARLQDAELRDAALRELLCGPTGEECRLDFPDQLLSLGPPVAQEVRNLASAPGGPLTLVLVRLRCAMDAGVVPELSFSGDEDEDDLDRLQDRWPGLEVARLLYPDTPLVPRPWSQRQRPVLFAADGRQLTPAAGAEELCAFAGAGPPQLVIVSTTASGAQVLELYRPANPLPPPSLRLLMAWRGDVWSWAVDPPRQSLVFGPLLGRHVIPAVRYHWTGQGWEGRQHPHVQVLPCDAPLASAVEAALARTGPLPELARPAICDADQLDRRIAASLMGVALDQLAAIPGRESPWSVRRRQQSELWDRRVAAGIRKATPGEAALLALDHCRPASHARNCSLDLPRDAPLPERGRLILSTACASCPDCSRSLTILDLDGQDAHLLTAGRHRGWGRLPWGGWVWTMRIQAIPVTRATAALVLAASRILGGVQVTAGLPWTRHRIHWTDGSNLGVELVLDQGGWSAAGRSWPHWQNIGWWQPWSSEVQANVTADLLRLATSGPAGDARSDSADQDQAACLVLEHPERWPDGLIGYAADAAALQQLPRARSALTRLAKRPSTARACALVDAWEDAARLAALGAEDGSWGNAALERVRQVDTPRFRPALAARYQADPSSADGKRAREYLLEH